MIASKHQIFLISGSSASSYFPQPMSAVTGTQSKNCFLAVKGKGIFHLGTDGIYLYTAGADACVTDSQFKPLFGGETVGSIPGWDIDKAENCVMEIWQNKLYFGYPRIGETYCKDFLVMDLESNKAVHYQFPFAIRSLTIDYQNKRLLAGDEDGYIWHLNHYGKTDDGTVIEYDLESKQFVQFAQYFPRYARWDVSLDRAAAVTGEVRLDDQVKQVHSIIDSRATRKRLIDTCTGPRLSARVHGTGSVKIYGVEIE